MDTRSLMDPNSGCAGASKRYICQFDCPGAKQQRYLQWMDALFSCFCSLSYQAILRPILPDPGWTTL